jgi:TusA-related sulfurtransferase
MTDHTSGTTEAMIDGGDLDCGSGLLLMIRNAMQPLNPGGVLEIRSREGSVREDLPAWCRMVGHALEDTREADSGYTYYFVRKKQEPQDAELSDDLNQAKDYEWRLRVKWDEGMRARVLTRNHELTIGAPVSFNTEDEHATAFEHLLGALGGCLLLGFQWRLTRHGVKVNNMELALQARVDNVLVFLGIEDTGHPGLSRVRGKLYAEVEDSDEADMDSILKDDWAEAVKRSPVAQSLLRGADIQVDFMRIP